MSEHHAFGIRRRARGVEQGGDDIRLYRGRPETGWTRLNDGVEIAEQIRFDCVGFAIRLFGGIDEGDFDWQIADRLLRRCQVLDVAEQQRTAAVLEQGRDLVGVQGGVERYRGAS